MSYYDFDYFWTHEEIGGQKLKVLEKPRRLNLIEEILEFIFENDCNSQNQAENPQEDQEDRD
ncbi:MAG: hypothetical protein WBM44_11120 [Waterburya sp.]